MSNHTAMPTDEPSSVASQKVKGPLPGQTRFLLPRGVRRVLTVTSACLAVAGLAMAVLGGIGTSNGTFFRELTGVNALVTGLMLLFTGVVGCVVVFISRTDTVKRWILLLLVTACHASGAFAVQCTIIVGMMVSRTPPCDDAQIAPPSDEMVTDRLPLQTCDHNTSALALCLAILLLSILGFVLGVLCSASSYYAAPRLLCCLCDSSHDHSSAVTEPTHRPGTAVEVEPVPAITVSADEQSQTEQGNPV